MTAQAYGWVQHAVARQCSHFPDESFSRHSHAHHAVLAGPPLQLYRHDIACTEKHALLEMHASTRNNPFILQKNREHFGRFAS
jgi:hypothetical protein